MRQLTRIPLPQRVLDALASYQSALDRAVRAERRKKSPEVGDRVDEAWEGRRSNAALQAVEEALRAMASGLERCMYCEDGQGCDVEHRYPRVPYPEKAFAWLNLLWICAICNRQKNSAFDEAMLDPTSDDPFDHLVLSISTGRYTAREESSRGSATLRVLRRLASDQTLARGRHNALMKLRTFLREYDAHHAAGRVGQADEIRRFVVEEPFSAAFAAVLRASTEPGANDVLGEELVAVLSRHPGMRRWLDEADAARAGAVQHEIDTLMKRIRIHRGLGKSRTKRVRGRSAPRWPR
jgi:hypothetical protein